MSILLYILRIARMEYERRAQVLCFKNLQGSTALSLNLKRMISYSIKVFKNHYISK